MGGVRNGRYMKWLLAACLCLSSLYVFYQYRGLSGALREKEEELERLEDLQGRLGDQLKDLAGSHTSLQDELKTERVSHHRTRMEKSALDKQCQVDLKSLKENADSEKYQLEQKRDSFKMELEEMKDSKQRIQSQQDSLLARYDQDIAACQDKQKETDAKLGSHLTDTAKANTVRQRVEAELEQCSSQLKTLEETLQIKQFDRTSLQSDLLSCQDNLQTSTLQKKKIEQDLQELKQQSVVGKMAAPGNLADKDAMFKAMSEKLRRGEQLNEHDKSILKLLKGEPEQGNQKFDPRIARNTMHVSDEQRGGQQARRFAPFPQGWPPAQDFGAPGGGGRGPGFNPGLPGGMESRRSPGEKQQLPELAEQEEVRELQIEEQEQPRGGREEKKGGGREEEDQGMGEQAFNPEDKKAVKEEEEGRDYGVDRVQAKPVENLNLPVPGGGENGGQPDLPNPHRVVVNEKEVDFESEAKIRSPPKFENPDRAFDNQDQMNEQEELEKEQGEEEVVDQLGHRQFEEDMKMDREERMRMRAVPRGQKEWNADQQGGMEQGLQEGVDDAMMQEMHVSDMRRKEAAKQLEAKDQQRRLNQPHFGQRENLR